MSIKLGQKSKGVKEIQVLIDIRDGCVDMVAGLEHEFDDLRGNEV